MHRKGLTKSEIDAWVEDLYQFGAAGDYFFIPRPGTSWWAGSPKISSARTNWAPSPTANRELRVLD